MNKYLWIMAAAVALLAAPTISEAKLLKKNQDPPTPAPAASPSDIRVAPIDTAGVVIPCCPQRCISYKYHRPCKKICCTCEAPIKTVLMVKDPCVCGCFIEVPVCLPACCTGAPEVCCHRGLLGRDVVEYNWCCGYLVKVVFDRRGDLTVHYYGS